MRTLLVIAVVRLCAARYCIDQTAIDQSVRRLPIFVVASKKMLVLLGSSYAARCWCMLELFVFACVIVFEYLFHFIQFDSAA